MRVVTRLFVLVAAGALTAGAAQAQKHEMGVDATLQYAKPSGGDGRISLATPVDVRMGWGASNLSWETRFALAYIKPKDGSFLSFTPDINALWKLNGATANKGMYLTGGVGLQYTNVDNGTTSASDTRVGLNAGLGSRHPIGDAALRTEVFVGYLLKKDTEVAETSFGVRFGISFWHGH
jgi:hypothetical protein